MSSVLRPLSLGEILDQTAQLYRRNFLLFAGTAVIPTAVIFGTYILIFVVAGVPMIVKSGGAATPNPVFGILFFALFLIAMPLILAAAVFSQAGVTRAAVSAFRGEKLKIREALASVKPRFWRYLALLILQGLLIIGIPCACAGAIGIAIFVVGRLGGALAVLGGFVFFCVVAAAFVAMVILGLEVCMALASCVVEDNSATDAIRRARKLSRGTRGRIFVMFLIVWCIMMVLSMIVYIPTVVIAGITAAAGHNAQNAAVVAAIMQIISLVINFSLQTLISPAYFVALVMFYFDQRVRLEGYDIEWMMLQAGMVTTAPEVTPDSMAGVSTAEANPASAQEQ